MKVDTEGALTLGGGVYFHSAHRRTELGTHGAWDPAGLRESQPSFPSLQETLSWPFPSAMGSHTASYVLRALALSCYSLGCPPWGTASPGAGSDLHVAHIQIPTKKNWLHTTLATYMRKKVWSMASAQLLEPFPPLGDAVGGSKDLL